MNINYIHFLKLTGYKYVLLKYIAKSKQQFNIRINTNNKC